MSDVRKIVVIVEEAEASKTGLQWALQNLLRHGDSMTLLHVFTCPQSKSRKKKNLLRRHLRLKGFQLALSFKDICIAAFPSTNIEILVTEGDQDAVTVTDMLTHIRPHTLVVGLHHRSFIYRMDLAHNNVGNKFNCRVLAIKQPQSALLNAPTLLDSSIDMNFSQIEIAALKDPDQVPSPKIRYKICPNPSAIIWRSRRTRRNDIS